jgi:hypothetical protein
MLQCYFKNRKEDNKPFKGKILTSYENFQRQSYIDLSDCKGIEEAVFLWNGYHVLSVNKEDILGFYENDKQFKKDYPQYFI